jgi:hypothetical protein
MYGLVNQGLKEMVCRERGQDVWREICVELGIPTDDFESLRPYPDSDTGRLIGAIAKRLNKTQQEVLSQFGKYWVPFTAGEGYGAIMDLFGHDLRSCLRNLNRMHGHMGAMMPQLKPPRFIVNERSDTHMIVHYYSTRSGLAPMVFGLLQGLADKFNEQIEIEHIPSGERSDHDEFEILFV